MTLVAGLGHIQIEAPAGGEADAHAFYGRVWFGLPDGRQLHVGVVAGFAVRTGGHPAQPSRNAP